jgi:tRNA A37 threonylcarbamoyladenosine modification protein TsaB
VHRKRVLAIEPSTRRLRVSLAEESTSSFRSLASISSPLPEPASLGSKWARALLEVISAILDEAQCGLLDIDLWAVGDGPGPGAWIARAHELTEKMAARTQRPWIAVSSLKTLAIEAAENAPLGAILVPMLSSNREHHVYAGIYAALGEPFAVELVQADAEYSIEQLRAELQAAKNTRLRGAAAGPTISLSRPTWFGIGAGWSEVAPQLAGVLSPLPQGKTLRPIDPSALMLAYAAAGAAS